MFHKIHTNEECKSTKRALQLENPENKINVGKGYFFAPPSAACFSAAFFCFSLIIAASLKRIKEKKPYLSDEKEDNKLCCQVGEWIEIRMVPFKYT